MADLFNSLITFAASISTYVIVGWTCLMIGTLFGIMLIALLRANGRDDSEPAYEDGEPRRE